MAALRYWPVLLLVGLPQLTAAQSLPAPAAAAPSFAWRLPRGFPTPFVPPDNPMSSAKVALGRRLFFDPRLSVTGHYSCASCHDPRRAYTDARVRAVGATGELLPRNAMALVNVAYNLAYGWQHPEITSLETQMLQPLFNRHPVELGLDGHEQQLIDALAADARYPRQFAAAFAAGASATAKSAANGTPVITMSRLIKAIAAYERTLIEGRSAFDEYVFEGRHTALSPGAKRGMALFFSERLGCAGCHSGFNFSGNWRDRDGATGKASFADDGQGVGPVRVPTLRNIELTAPYMHDGRFATLDAVLDHYQRVGMAPDDAHGGQRDTRLKAFTLNARERADLKAFLRSLTSSPTPGGP